MPFRLTMLLCSIGLCLASAALVAQKPKDESAPLPPSRTEVRESQNNLRQLGIAMHNYLGATGAFPADIKSADGTVLLSWRVQILPYIEQEALYKEFKRDQAWDSEHNKKLVEKLPRLFAPVRGKTDKGHTFYQCFRGPGAFLDKQPLKIQQITDGTSNTIMIVEAGSAVPWTKPEDVPFDPKKDVPKLGGLFDGDFHAVLADGSVRGFKKDIKPDTLKALITVAGGEIINLDK